MFNYHRHFLLMPHTIIIAFWKKLIFKLVMLIKMKQQWTCITVNLTLSVLENKRNFSEFIKTILVNKEELGAKTAFIPVKF